MRRKASLYYVFEDDEFFIDVISSPAFKPLGIPKKSQIYLVGYGKQDASKILTRFKSSLKLKKRYLTFPSTGNYPGVRAAKTSLPPGVYYGPIEIDTYNTEHQQRLKMLFSYYI